MQTQMHRVCSYRETSEFWKPKPTPQEMGHRTPLTSVKEMMMTWVTSMCWMMTATP